MRFSFKRGSVAIAAALALTGLGLAPASAIAAPDTAQSTHATPPATSGLQAKPAVAAGSVNAKSTARLGETQSVKTDATGKPAAASQAQPNTGYVTGVDFTAPYNYCQQGFVYTPVRNTTSSLKYVEVVLYANGGYSTFYTSVAAGGTSYPYFYGISGTYYAYLYVWNGSAYSYDEYETSANNCGITWTFTKYPGYTGYVRLDVKNYGNAYASVDTNELSPFPGYSTYTGQHWLYPAAGATVTQYFYVATGTSYPYGIYSSVYGSLYYGTQSWSGHL